MVVNDDIDIMRMLKSKDRNILVVVTVFNFGHYVPQHLPAKAIHHQSHEHPTKLGRLSIDAPVT